MGDKPKIRLYIADDEGNIDYKDNDRQIALWENEDKAGGLYLKGRTPQGKKIIGFYVE